jgi:DNA-binding LacI/PurR family transcriptional regulator
MNNIEELVSRKPKYIVIADNFREQITSGTLPKGTRLLPDNELARKYHVNKRTVAASLNALVKEGLLERVPRRGTFVISNGNYGKKNSNAVGMVMLSTGDVYQDIAQGITAGLLKEHLYPITISRKFVDEASNIESFMKLLISDETKPYGFIINGELEFPFEFLKQNVHGFNNLVFIVKYHNLERIDSAKYVLVDFAEAGRLAARHFISAGHKRLVCLAMPEPDYTYPIRSIQVQIMQGFAEVCKESCVKFGENIFWELLHGAPLDKTVKSLLASSDERPDAIFSYNDSFIRYQVLPLLKNDMDIELIGFYNTHHAEECGFSSISIHEDKIAENAIKLLTKEINKKEIFIKPELVVRK